MPQTIFKFRNYTKEEAYEALPDIAQATIDGWFATDLAAGKFKRVRRFPFVASVPLIAGADLLRLAHQARGTAWCMGE